MVSAISLFAKCDDSVCEQNRRQFNRFARSKRPDSNNFHVWVSSTRSSKIRKIAQTKGFGVVVFACLFAEEIRAKGETGDRRVQWIFLLAHFSGHKRNAFLHQETAVSHQARVKEILFSFLVFFNECARSCRYSFKLIQNLPMHDLKVEKKE
jgi:hypothetical protein